MIPHSLDTPRSCELKGLIECETTWLFRFAPAEFNAAHTSKEQGSSRTLMTDISNDETRLRATETQMRRALGLESTSRQPAVAAPTSASVGPHRPTRRFVRDGEVAVSVIHHDAAVATKQLEVARQTIQSQTAAREQAERRLTEAQEAIRALQTQLAHARLARDEAFQRADDEKHAADLALASLRAELLSVRTTLQQTERRLQRLQATEDPPGRRVGTTQRSMADDLPEGAEEPMAPEPPAPTRRRGRPRKVIEPEPESDFVEWWKPGWKGQFR